MAKTVLVSAGHDSSQPGACANGLKEADLTLSLRDKVVDQLHYLGIATLTDGRVGENKPLVDAIKLCAQVDGPKVEIHFNSGPELARGVECLSTVSDRDLAVDLVKSVASITGSPARGDSLGWKAEDSGQHSRLGFIRAGGLILEVEFISNPTEIVNYLSKESEVASSIARTLALYAGG